ncbi:hypothetical protein MRX96_026218 [Rhipicephalus microplus]
MAPQLRPPSVCPYLAGIVVSLSRRRGADESSSTGLVYLYGTLKQQQLHVYANSPYGAQAEEQKAFYEIVNSVAGIRSFIHPVHTCVLARNRGIRQPRSVVTPTERARKKPFGRAFALAARWKTRGRRAFHRFRRRVGSSFSVGSRCALVPRHVTTERDFRESPIPSEAKQRGQGAETSGAAKPHLARVYTVVALPQESAEFDSACLFEEYPPFKEAGRRSHGRLAQTRFGNYGKWAASDVQSMEAQR